MKLGDLRLNEGLSRALEWFDIRYQAEERVEAGDLCNAFEKNARKVPRNICTDPSVEAKRAVSECLKTGFSALKRSILYCVAQGDDAYQKEYFSSLQTCCNEYLDTSIRVLSEDTDEHRRLNVVFYRKGVPYSLKLQLDFQAEQKVLPFAEFIFQSRATGTRREANDADFLCLMDKN